MLDNTAVLGLDIYSRRLLLVNYRFYYIYLSHFIQNTLLAIIPFIFNPLTMQKLCKACLYIRYFVSAICSVILENAIASLETLAM